MTSFSKKNRKMPGVYLDISTLFLFIMLNHASITELHHAILFELSFHKVIHLYFIYQPW